MEILLWLWQIPQNIIGLILRWMFPGKVYKYQGADVVVSGAFPGGISLGRTIIINDDYILDIDVWEHEYGHTRQSLYLGPLYLLIIGIPSLIWAWLWKRGCGRSYYSFYTEKWADKLGGVERK